ncbi:MAG: bifunctional glycosyltransferase family 2/GtrA family protein [Tetrasphaera sp.]
MSTEPPVRGQPRSDAGSLPEAPSGPVLVIPSLHPGEDFPEIVRRTRDLGLREVVVIDDGSGAAYAHIFAAIGAIDGCTVLTHSVNRGKGAALKTALRYCLSRPEVTGIVTADSDGQHLPQDIRRVAAELAEAERAELRAAVLGIRDFTLPDLPLRSRLGNKATTAVITALFGRVVRDTQTGLRAFSRGLFEELLALDGERFDYEMNVLIYLLQQRLPFRGVVISTVYHDRGNTVSHFRPVRDSMIVYRGIVVQAVRFALSSFTAAVVDLVTFTAVIDYAFGGTSALRGVAVATLTARLVSGLVNYEVNRHIVFASDHPRGISMLRYLLLALGIVAASAVGTSVLGTLLAGHVVWAKVIVDSALFVASYLVQKRWVFAPGRAGPKSLPRLRDHTPNS